MKNLGSIDRAVRLLPDVAALGAILVVTGPVRCFGLTGLVPLLTTAVSFCPSDTLPDLRTCPAHSTGA